MTQGILEEFVVLWVAINPMGKIPIFVGVTAGMEASIRARVALNAALFAAAVLMFFLVAGQFLIDALGIGLPSFQIAGGVVLFLLALTMIFGKAKPELADDVDPQRESPAVFPLAVPSLAGPGAMLAIVLLTDNNRFSVPEQAVTAGIMLSVVAMTYLLMLAAGPILKVIGVGGAEVLSRVMGLILATIAVDNVVAAVIELLRTTEI